MPNVSRRYTKAKKANKRKAYRKKRAQGSRNSISTYRLGRNYVLPKSMTIRQDYALQGYVPAGVYTTGYFDIYANRAADALDTTADFVAATNRTGVITLANAITMNSNMIEQLLGDQKPYNASRVMSSSIRVTCNPASLSDMLYLQIIPYNSAMGAVTIVPTSAGSTQLPGGKYKLMCSNYANAKANTLSHSRTTASHFGVTPRTVLSDNEYLADNSSTFVTSPTRIAYWRVLWSTANGTNVSSPIVFNIQLKTKTRLEVLNVSEAIL